MQTPYDKTRRRWTNPQGYQYLGVWKNAAVLRLLIRKFTAGLPAKEFRLKTQLNDAARSFKANIEEGFKRPTTKEYLDYLGFCQGSLEEVRGDIENCLGDGFLASRPESSLEKIGISLTAKGTAKGITKGFDKGLDKGFDKGLDKGTAKGITKGFDKGLDKGLIKGKDKGYAKYKVNLREIEEMIARVDVKDLSYEIFIELLNKTEYLLRRQIESLRIKLTKEQEIIKKRIVENFHQQW